MTASAASAQMPWQGRRYKEYGSFEFSIHNGKARSFYEHLSEILQGNDGWAGTAPKHRAGLSGQFQFRLRCGGRHRRSHSWQNRHHMVQYGKRIPYLFFCRYQSLQQPDGKRLSFRRPETGQPGDGGVKTPLWILVCRHCPA